MRNVINEYVINGPSFQIVLDLFKNERSSIAPEEYGLETLPGKAILFDDARIKGLNEMANGFSRETVLELGPQERGRTC